MSKIRKIMGQNIDIGLTQEDVVTIQNITPVRTGKLRANFALIDGEIKNPVYYGAWVERGTVRFVGRFMVARSIPEIAGRLIQRVGKQMERAKLFNLPKRS